MESEGIPFLCWNKFSQMSNLIQDGSIEEKPRVTQLVFCSGTCKDEIKVSAGRALAGGF